MANKVMDRADADSAHHETPHRIGSGFPGMSRHTMGVGEWLDMQMIWQSVTAFNPRNAMYHTTVP